LKNLREQVIMLGTVSRAEVFSLYRQSICVLNPTRFEGLGLSVAEAQSLGKRMLLADLPVLREQAAPGAIYFNPQDPNELAQCMEQIWNSVPSGPDLALEDFARKALPDRQRAFAQAFVHIAQEAIDLPPSRRGHNSQVRPIDIAK
jgi:glycosyltransferase involved in cell wall biosynthesis